MTDPVLRVLAGLPAAEPDPVHAARVRAACRAALARRRAADRWLGPPRRVGAFAWRPLLAGLGAVYLAASIRLAMHFTGVL